MQCQARINDSQFQVMLETEGDEEVVSVYLTASERGGGATPPSGSFPINGTLRPSRQFDLQLRSGADVFKFGSVKVEMNEPESSCPTVEYQMLEANCKWTPLTPTVGGHLGNLRCDASGSCPTG